MANTYFDLLPLTLAFEVPEQYRPLLYGFFFVLGIWLVINARSEGAKIKRARAPESDAYSARFYIFGVRLAGLWFLVWGGLLWIRHYHLFPEYRWLTEWLR